MLWTWIPTKPREKGPLFKITKGCPVGLWVMTEFASTCWMPFSPPHTILELSDPFGSPKPPNRDYSFCLLLLDWSPEGWRNLPKSQNGANSPWPQRSWLPGPCLSALCDTAFQKLEVLLELGGFPLLMSRIWVHFGRREPISACYEEAVKRNTSW